MDKTLKALSQSVTQLPRGGYIVDTAVGYIQFGSPPETIKDTMSLPKSVPQYFVLPRDFFNWNKGISVAELEFPIYYNYFLRQKKTFVICSVEQVDRIKAVLTESLFGPDTVFIRGDYDDRIPDDQVPNIKSEMDYFRGNRVLSDFVEFYVCSVGGQCRIQNVGISLDEQGDFIVTQDEKTLASVPGKIEYTATYLIGERLHEPFVPPLFGMTCLGPSHGFDPKDNTSGFIIWVNHRGIMVDPPVNSTEWLADSNVNAKFIDSIILTHTHADHDAGAFQKILVEGKITVYTTRTVIQSFVRKYAALIDVKESYLLRLFHFNPVFVGKPLFIHGARIKWFYTLHSIPTISFTIKFQDRVLVYSSDHNNDPTLHQRLFDEGRITKNRYEQLRRFPWDASVIYHESGVPPLHTPISYLNALPVDVQKKIIVYHIARKDFPEKTDLKLAKFGIEHTEHFQTDTPKYDWIYRVLGILKQLDFFSDLPVSKVQEFVTGVNEEKYRKGEYLVRKGETGNKFFIIYAGNVAVINQESGYKKIYGAYDYFGELALLMQTPRAADVVAETDVTVFTLDKERFISFIANTEFEGTLYRLARLRDDEKYSQTWAILSQSPVFQRLSASQSIWLESVLTLEEVPAGVIIPEGQELPKLSMVRHGAVKMLSKGNLLRTLRQGELLGSVSSLCNREPSAYTFHCDDPVELFSVSAKDALNFFDRNPGLIMKLEYSF